VRKKYMYIIVCTGSVRHLVMDMRMFVHVYACAIQ